MRRAVVAIIGTAVGTSALIGLKAGLAAGHPDHGSASRSPGTAGSVPSGSPAPSGGPATGGAGGGPAGPGGTGGPGGPVRSAPAVGSALHAGTFTGPVTQTPYGPVQVRITVAGGRLTEVAAVQLPKVEARSLDIDKNNVPKLRQEALKAQSAKIDSVSGATYTSQAYKDSLQAALDAAHRG